MAKLQGKVALVTGASRGVGKGIAVGLGEAGATLYVTGRTVEEGKAAVALAGTVGGTAQEITAIGGRGIAVPCDHTDDEQVRTLFAQIEREQGRLDILVNAVWGGYEHFNDGTEFWNEKNFWTQSISRWDKCFAAGVRAHYVASWLAAPMMVRQGGGLIVNISSLGAEQEDVEVSYGVAKLATNRMTHLMARELKEHGVAVVCLYPGLVRTEGVLKAGDFFDLSNSESPLFNGRVVAALAADEKILERSGEVLFVAEAAEGYGVFDEDGKRPTSLRP